MAEKTYVAILDSVGYTTKDGNPVYATRGQEVSADADTTKRLLDREVHPPLGAIAEKDSRIARAMQTAILPTVHPDNARAHILALAEQEFDQPVGQVDPAGRDATKEVTQQDPSVAFSRMAQAADPNAKSPYAELSDKDLKAQAKERGVDVGTGKKFDRAEVEQQLQSLDAEAAMATTATETTPRSSGTYA